MAIEVGDGVLKIGADSKDLDRALNASENNAKKAFSSVSKYALAMGAAITGVAALSLKAYAEEEVGITRLRMAMASQGQSYDEVRGSLEQWIQVQMHKTAFSDGEQRDSLAQLMLVTGDLSKAQGAMTVAMDLARAKGIDLGSATDAVTKALGGNWARLELLEPALRDVATAEEKWAMWQKIHAGQAEAYGKTLEGQTQILRNNIEDITETIGGFLLPVVTSLLTNVISVTDRIKEWAEANPVLAGAIVKVALGAGLLLTVLGTLGMVLPAIITGIGAVGTVFGLLISPVGLAVAAIVGAAVLIWQNWATVSKALVEALNWVGRQWASIWSSIAGIVKAFGVALLIILSPVILGIGGLVAVGVYVYKNWKEISALLGKLWQGLAGVANTVFGGLVDAIRWTMQKVAEVINWVVQQAKNIFSLLPDWIQNPLKDARDIVVNLTGEMKTQAVKQLGNLADFVGEKFEDSKDLVGGYLSGILDNMGQTFQYAAPDIIKDGLARMNAEEEAGLKAMADTAEKAAREAEAAEKADRAHQIEMWNQFYALRKKQEENALAEIAAFKKLQAENETTNLAAEQAAKNQIRQDAFDAEYQAVIDQNNRMAALYAQITGTKPSAHGAQRGRELADIEAAIRALDTRGELTGAEQAQLNELYARRSDLEREAEGFQFGGVVPGPIGRPMIAKVHGGEVISPPGAMTANVIVYLDGEKIGESVGKKMVNTIRVRHGIYA